jgi:hypothetical protein
VALDLVPGPGARSFRAKTMRQLPFHGPGGPSKLRIVDCGMRIEKQRPKNPKSAFRICIARSARRILRKPVGASQKGASPADAFCPEAPCPRAATQASRNCQSAIRHRRRPAAEPGVYHSEIIGFRFPECQGIKLGEKSGPRGGPWVSGVGYRFGVLSDRSNDSGGPF